MQVNENNSENKSESEDVNSGTLPFTFDYPLVKYVLEAGKKVVRYSLGLYHMTGFTRGRNHVKLIKIEKECGDYDPDIYPDLELMDNPKKMQEFEQVARNYVNENLWTTGNQLDLNF